ncbi:MAG: hypothetical protein WC619_00790 [Patescibacteria group bacterium]
MKKILLFSFAFLSLFQLGTIAWSLGLKLPELPETEAEIHFSEGSIPLANFSPLRPFPNLTEAGENQPSFCSLSYNLYPKAIILENETWNKVKETWNGPLVNVVTKITTESNNGFLAWMVAQSFFNSIADAKVHSHGNMKYFAGDDDWHVWNNCQHFCAVMATLSFARRVFIEKIPLKVGLQDLSEGGMIRFVVFNITTKIVKGGFSAYNDPRYNQHTLPYWGFENGKLTDKYISTGRTSTWVVDGGAIGGFILMKKWKW